MAGSSVLKDRVILLGLLSCIIAIALIGTTYFCISRIIFIEKEKQAALDEAQKFQNDYNKLFLELEKAKENENNNVHKSKLSDNWYESITPIQGNYNVRMGTLGGDFWWSDLDSYRGWRLQKQWFTGHCRILDPASYRCAWGRENDMRESFNDVKRQIDDLFNSPSSQ